MQRSKPELVRSTVIDGRTLRVHGVETYLSDHHRSLKRLRDLALSRHDYPEMKRLDIQITRVEMRYANAQRLEESA